MTSLAKILLVRYEHKRQIGLFVYGLCITVTSFYIGLGLVLYHQTKHQSQLDHEFLIIQKQALLQEQHHPLQSIGQKTLKQRQHWRLQYGRWHKWLDLVAKWPQQAQIHQVKFLPHIKIRLFVRSIGQWQIVKDFLLDASGVQSFQVLEMHQQQHGFLYVIRMNMV